MVLMPIRHAISRLFAAPSHKWVFDIKKILKYASFSGVATAVDFLLFRFLFVQFLEPFWADLSSASIGFLINFFFQRKYVFILKRDVKVTFLLSIGFSLIVMLMGSFLMDQLVKTGFFATYLSLAKIVVIGFKFVLNYTSKKWVFERTLK